MLKSNKCGPLAGNTYLPGDKSISHRGLMLGALANGQTTLKGFLNSEDCIATQNAFIQMGVKIQTEANNPTHVIIQGVGLNGLQAPKAPLDFGNAGTGIRLMAGVMAGQSFNSVLTGDESLQSRPMARVVTPLSQMGANITSSSDKMLAPLTVKGGQALQGITYELPVASAQVKSSILLASLYATGHTTIMEPKASRDHTERMFKTFGVDLTVSDNTISIDCGQSLKGATVEVPGDISSAAFFMVAASIIPGSTITLKNVGINPTRTGVIDILRLMGADIELSHQRDLGFEPVADITVKYAQLKGIEIPTQLIVSAIDEFPILFIAASCATGKTRLQNASELRVKESDRIGKMAEGLKACGIELEEYPDGIEITGGVIQPGEIDCAGDHRVAMAFLIAGARCERGSIMVGNTECIATSFPGFVDIANQVGLEIN